MKFPYHVFPLPPSSRVYTPPDPSGYFDGYVWPMYLKNREEMQSMVSGIGECPCLLVNCTRQFCWNNVVIVMMMRSEMAKHHDGVDINNNVVTLAAGQLFNCNANDLFVQCVFFTVFLDGLKSKEELLAAVYKDVSQETKRLTGKWQNIFNSICDLMYFE